MRSPTSGGLETRSNDPRESPTHRSQTLPSPGDGRMGWSSAGSVGRGCPLCGRPDEPQPASGLGCDGGGGGRTSPRRTGGRSGLVVDWLGGHGRSTAGHGVRHRAGTEPACPSSSGLAHPELSAPACARDCGGALPGRRSPVGRVVGASRRCTLAGDGGRRLSGGALCANCDHVCRRRRGHGVQSLPRLGPGGRGRGAIGTLASALGLLAGPVWSDPGVCAREPVG